MSIIIHRDGHEAPFDPAVLERSLQQAFAEIGVRDEITVRNIAERIAEQAFELFATETKIPSSRIQTIVSNTLQALGHPEAGTVYSRQHAPATPASSVVEEKRAPESAPSQVKPIPAAPIAAVASNYSATGESYSPRRRRLNEERKALTHKFQVGGQEGYLTVGLYDDGQPGEIFLKMSKEGSMLSGLMDCFATSISIGLQYGVPLKVMARKFMAVTFEPNGPTENPNIPEVHSIVDYVFRWLSLKFLSPEDRQAIDAELREINVNMTETEPVATKLAL